MRELRRKTEGQDQDNQQKPKDAAPGQSKENPGHKDGGSRVNPPQQSGNPLLGPSVNDGNELLQASLTFQLRPAQSGGSETALRERSTIWTA
jgi:hypothetical protein